MDITKRNLCFLDLETTGFDPQKDSVIEISFVVHAFDGQEIDRFDTVTVPQKSPLTPFVSELTGITQTEIDTDGKVFDEHLKETIQAKIGDAIIVGHNIDFDINFLEANGIPVAKNGRLDTHELARIVLLNEPSYALEILSKKYEFQHTNAHRAMSDVEVSIDLYKLLVEKINALPTEFLSTIKSCLETNQQWLAGSLFLNSKATGTHAPHREKAKSPLSVSPTKNIDASEILEKSTEKSQFIRAGVTNRTTNLQQELAEKSGKKSLIITEKFDYFEGISLFPIPEVLLDPERLNAFGNQEKLTDQATFFYVQLSFRHFLGFRGKSHCDLFFQQENLWQKVCVKSTDNKVFQDIITERAAEKIIVLSPAAFCRFHDLPLFQDRLLIIDEAEKFAEKMLFSPSKTINLLPFLEQNDEAVATAMQFWVSNFCQEVIKPRLGHEIGPFGVKELLKEHDIFPELAKSLEQFEGENIQKLAEILHYPTEHLVRWYNYLPDKGALSFSYWHPDDWRSLKQAISGFNKILFYRHKPSQSHAFFRIFCGIDDGDWHEAPALYSDKTWTVPEDLISSRSPEHNQYCARLIYDTAKTHSDENLAVLFSSGETLRKVLLDTNAFNLDGELHFLGERVNGGAGKLLELMKKRAPATTFFHKMNGKNLAEFQFKTVVLQKFLFNPPHPLLDKLDESFQDGIKLWDVWTIPQVSANMARRVADFPNTEEIICLDGRENAAWGKEILESAFPEIFERK